MKPYKTVLNPINPVNPFVGGGGDARDHAPGCLPVTRQTYPSEIISKSEAGNDSEAIASLNLPALHSKGLHWDRKHT